MRDVAPFAEQYARVCFAYDYKTVGDVGIFTIPALSALRGIDHGFSARTGGVSTGPFESLNLSFTRPEEAALVFENYRRFGIAAGFPLDSMVLDNYEHGNTVRNVDSADAGRGYTRETLDFCDALVTNDPAVTLITGHADCMAFYVVDPVKRAIGLAHAGWRGALARIGRNLAERLIADYGANPDDLIAGVGPSICPDCFEVGDDVADAFSQAFRDVPCRFADNTGKAHIDLWKIAAAQFFEAGILPEHVFVSGVCTKEDERLFSYRRAQGPTGGMAAFLRLL